MTADDEPTLLIPRPGGIATGVPQTGGIATGVPQPGGPAPAMPAPDDDPATAAAAPGHQATVVMKRPSPAALKDPRSAAPSVALELQRMVAGIHPLLGAAGPLLALIAQLRRTTSHDQPVVLRRQLLACVADFERQAAAGAVPRPKIVAARYLLCSFVDETIALTPWGCSGPWAERNLLQEFHEERSGGEKAFALLDRLGQEPQANADLLELFYVCLRLGFEGRYRGLPNGRTTLDALAARMLDVIRPSDAAAQARALAPHWQGVAAPSRRETAVLPLWVLLALSAAVMLGVFLFFNARLDAMTRPLVRRIVALPTALSLSSAPAHARAPASASAPASSQSAARPRLAAALQADVTSGALTLQDQAQRSLITLAADALFVPGSAHVDARQQALVARVALALKDSPGLVAVIGHTDDAAVSSPQFPSQWHLSHERARAVLALLTQAGVPAERLRAEGRADAEPLQANDSAAARARNRRIEIELRPPRPGA